MNEARGRKRKLSNEGKRSVHVKWDGKTIALGTFPDDKASVICSTAKVFTKRWRSENPKPSVEKVKESLERMGIRVVNERPGRQSNKKGSTRPNQKGAVQEEGGISSVLEIQDSCTLVSATVATPPIPPRAISTTTMTHHPRTDSIANVAERGTPPLSCIEFKANSFTITPNLREPLSGIMTPPYIPKQRIVSVGSRQGNDDPPVDAPRTKFRETDSQVQDQGIRRVAHPKPELYSDMTYQMLEKHHLNIKTEMEETEMLLNFYKERLRKRKSEKLINEQIAVQIDPIISNHAPSLHIHPYHDYQNDEIETSQAGEMLELHTSMSNIEETDSVAQMIMLEDW